MSKRITPPALARLWGVSPDKITALIKSGQLEAINLAANPRGRPRFSISEEAIRSFELRRSVIAPTSGLVRRERKEKSTAKVTEWF